MVHASVEAKAQILIGHIKQVRCDVANAVGIMAMHDAGGDQETVDAINSQPLDFVQCAAVIQDAITISAFASMARAFDEDRKKEKEVSSFPTIFHILNDPSVQRAAGSGEQADVFFRQAFDCWGRLSQVCGIAGLEYAIRTGRGTEHGKSGLISAIRDVRNRQFAHSLPDKATLGRKFFRKDLACLIDYSIKLIDPLCKATGITSVSVENDKEIWHRRGRVFWRHQTMPLDLLPSER